MATSTVSLKGVNSTGAAGPGGHRSTWTTAQRVRVMVVAFGLLALGAALFAVQGAQMASRAPLSFHLHDVPPETSGLAFVHQKPAFHSYFDNVYPFLAAVGAAGCVADVDNNGSLDLLLTTEGQGARNAFYSNVSTTDGLRFERVALDAIEDVNHDGFTTDCLFADVDNNGFVDLLLGRAASAPRLYKNVAAETAFGRTFVDVTSSAGLPAYMNGFASSFLDVDRDGDLDLVMADYFRARYAADDVPGAPYIHNLRIPNAPGQGRMMPNNWGRADNGGEKHLLLNDGSGHFVEQSLEKWGLSETRFTFDIGTADINQDGWTDLYFANDFGPDQLYLNQGGTRFVDVKGRYPTDVGRDSFKGMNADLHDVDNDGFPEIYVTNVFHPALPEGNLFWKNQPHESGDPFLRSFTNIAADNGTKNGGWGWGAKFVDIDNDRDVDVVATNGYISGDPDREYWYAVSRLIAGNADYIADSINWPAFDGRSMSGHQVSHVFVRGEHRYFDRAEDVGVQRVFDGRGVIVADFDVDGRPDIVFVPQGTAPQLLHNRRTPDAKEEAHQFIGLRLRGNGTTVPVTPVGTQVVVTSSDGTRQYREISAGNGMTSQSMAWVHVGLGDEVEPPTVEVRWSDGHVERLGPLAPGRYHDVTRAAAAPRPAAAPIGGVQ